MATSVYHAQSSVSKWGGSLDDYLPIHNWFDFTKAFHPDFRHRALRHHSLGIQECINEFGDYIELDSGKKVPVKLIAEQHVKEDCGRVPSVSEWLINLTPVEWMSKAQNISKIYDKKNGSKSITGPIAKVVK